MDLAKRFSLDYLISGSGNAPRRGSGSELASDAMNRSIEAVVSPVLRQLDKESSRPKRLFELLDAIRPDLKDIDIDGLREVIRWMEKVNLVKAVEIDPHGNDLIKKA